MLLQNQLKGLDKGELLSIVASNDLDSQDIMDVMKQYIKKPRKSKR